MRQICTHYKTAMAWRAIALKTAGNPAEAFIERGANKGCIALTNEEIRELRQFIQPGATVIIQP